MKLLLKLLATLAIVIGLVASAPVAEAFADTTGAIVATTNQTPASLDKASVGTSNTTPVHLNSSDSGASSGGSTTVPQSDLLEFSRWNDSSDDLHGRFDSWTDLMSTAYSQRTVISFICMSTGNLLYSAGSGMIQFADSLNIAQSAGAMVDQVFADVGNALINSPIAMGIVVLALGGAIFGLRRGQSPVKRIVSIVIVFGLMATMSIGASNSRGGGIDGNNGTFKPGVMSPSWVVLLSNNVITAVTKGVTTQLENAEDSLTAQDSITNYGTCAPYFKNLDAQAAATDPSPLQTLLNNSWEQEGLSAFETAQYGDVPIAKGNPATFGENVICHQLDWGVTDGSASPTQQEILMFGSTKNVPAGMSLQSALWGNTSGNDDEDQSLVGWASCVPTSSGTWTVEPGFDQADSGQDITAHTCQTIANNPDDTPDDLNFSSTQSGVEADFAKTNPSDAADQQAKIAAVSFLENLHGNDASNGTFILMTYMIAALCSCIVYIGLAVIVLCAKLAAVAMSLALVFAFFAAMLRGSGTDVLVKYAKTYLGFSVLALGASSILAIIALLSTVAQRIGSTAFGGPGSFMALLWAGVSPLMAVLMLHWIFKKVLKLPSPVTPSGALAFGAAAGGIGGVVGASAMGRLQNMAGRGARGAASLAGRGASAGAGKAAQAATWRNKPKTAAGRAGAMTPGNSQAKQLTNKPNSSRPKGPGPKSTDPQSTAPRSTSPRRGSAPLDGPASSPASASTTYVGPIGHEVTNGPLIEPVQDTVRDHAAREVAEDSMQEKLQDATTSLEPGRSNEGKYRRMLRTTGKVAKYSGIGLAGAAAMVPLGFGAAAIAIPGAMVAYKAHKKVGQRVRANRTSDADARVLLGAQSNALAKKAQKTKNDAMRTHAKTGDSTKAQQMLAQARELEEKSAALAKKARSARPRRHLS